MIYIIISLLNILALIKIDSLAMLKCDHWTESPVALVARSTWNGRFCQGVSQILKQFNDSGSKWRLFLSLDRPVSRCVDFGIALPPPPSKGKDSWSWLVKWVKRGSTTAIKFQSHKLTPTWKSGEFLAPNWLFGPQNPHPGFQRPQSFLED